MEKKFDQTFQLAAKSEGVHEDEKYLCSRERWEYHSRTLELAPAPLHVDIELTNACNLRCIMCERQNMKRKVGLMSFELFSQITGQCVEYDIDSIKLNLWGESTMHPELGRMIAHAKSQGILNTQFNTNGVLVDEKAAREIFESGLDRLTFSVDGASRETYEKIRDKSDYGRVMRNLEGLFELKQKHGYQKPYITLQIIRMKDTDEEIEGFINRWRGVADYITVTNIGTTSGMEDNLELSARDMKALKKVPCPQLWQRLSVYWNGDVTVCCSDFDGYLKIGRVPEDSLLSLWHSRELNNLRARHKNLDFTSLICQPCTGNLA